MILGFKESLLGLINESVYNFLKKEELVEIFDIYLLEMLMFYNFLNELEEDGYICFIKKGKIVFFN